VLKEEERFLVVPKTDQSPSKIKIIVFYNPAIIPASRLNSSKPAFSLFFGTSPVFLVATVSAYLTEDRFLCKFSWPSFYNDDNNSLKVHGPPFL
jgi:hypothetical protein